jgi:hypothetical protein
LRFAHPAVASWQQTKRRLFDSRTNAGIDAARQLMLALDANAPQNPARAETATRMSVDTPDALHFKLSSVGEVVTGRFQ